MTLLRSLLVVTITLAPLAAVADIVGLSIGGGSWQASPEGDIGRTDIDLESTLNLDEENNQFIFIALEHPVPVLPNIRLQQSEMEWTGNALVTAGTDLNGSPFVSDEQVDVSLDLSHIDATFYYEVLDNVVDLDLGITARAFDGQASLVGVSQQESIDLDAVGPLLYGKVGVDVPLTGLSAHMIANWIDVDEFSLVDWAAQLTYEFGLIPAVDTGLILGYRSMSVELDDLDDLQSDASFEGYYLAFQLHF
ncbi:MAG: TIGR04219 family outer membrane beta-barrel protein [Porticoccaceae bacterium]